MVIFNGRCMFFEFIHIWTSRLVQIINQNKLTTIFKNKKRT